MATAAPAQTFISPFQMNWVDKITLGYGTQLAAKFGGGIQRAIDISMPTGTPVYAPADGTIAKKEYNDGGGNYLAVAHAGGIETGFAHLDSYAPGIAAGAKVVKGQIIAYSGNTGKYTTGPHAWFQVKKNGVPINPLDLFDPTGKAGSKSDYKSTIMCRSVIPFVGMDKSQWKPTNKDGGCDFGYIQVDTTNVLIDLQGTPLEGAADTVDAVPKLAMGVGGFIFDPKNWAALLALLGGVGLMVVGGKMIWDAV
jgi:hypothetical protein